MNKVVVITGASSGIGLALYKKYKEIGDIPICLGKDNKENLENFIYCDVSQENIVKNAFNEIKEKYGKVDILINNAGFGISGAIELEKTSIVKSLFDVNYFGPLYCYQNVLPLMQKGSKIINTCSICALIPVPFRGFYSASKASLLSMGLAEYMELKDYGISVINICPGQVKSNFEKNRIKNFSSNEKYEKNFGGAMNTLKKTEKKRMNTEKVAKIFVKESYKKNPKPMRVIGFKYKIFYFFYKLLPLKTFLYFNNKFLGK